MNRPTCFHTDDRILNIFNFFVPSTPLLAPPHSKPEAADLCLRGLPSPQPLVVLGQQETLAEPQRVGGKWEELAFIPPPAYMWGSGRCLPLYQIHSFCHLSLWTPGTTPPSFMA